jgi:hypothetical protein
VLAHLVYYLGYRLNGMNHVLIPDRSKNFLVSQSIQINPRAHPASLLKGYQRLLLQRPHLHLVPRLRMHGTIPSLSCA